MTGQPSLSSGDQQKQKRTSLSRETILDQSQYSSTSDGPKLIIIFRIWGTFSWAVTFIFSANTSKLQLDLKIDSDDIECGKEDLPGGDGGIKYQPDPVDSVKKVLPKEEFEEALKTMRQLFVSDWVFGFSSICDALADKLIRSISSLEAMCLSSNAPCSTITEIFFLIFTTSSRV